MATATIVTSISRRAIMLCIVGSFATTVLAQPCAASIQSGAANETGVPEELVNMPTCWTDPHRDPDICKVGGS